jgi:protease-4
MALIITAVALVLGASAFFHSPRALGPRVGVVHIDGMIFDAAPVVDFIEQLKNDDSVLGVVLRVDSPGGAIAPSQELFQAVDRLNQAKPVVASYGSVAASGGYYASCPAEWIVANPGSITGSIGVLLEYLDVHELAERFGVRQELLATGAQKGAGSPLRELTPEQRQVFQDMLMDMHAQFVADVAYARSIRHDKVAQLADGRAYTGRQALALGLVDELGTFDDALWDVMDYCDIDETPELVEGPEFEVPFIDRVLGAQRVDSLMRAASGSLRFLYK